MNIGPYITINLILESMDTLLEFGLGAFSIVSNMKIQTHLRAGLKRSNKKAMKRTNQQRKETLFSILCR